MGKKLAVLEQTLLSDVNVQIRAWFIIGTNQKSSQSGKKTFFHRVVSPSIWGLRPLCRMSFAQFSEALQNSGQTSGTTYDKTRITYTVFLYGCSVERFLRSGPAFFHKPSFYGFGGGITLVFFWRELADLFSPSHQLSN